jgi:mitochondrial enoyl-[acyl-carrier protein] reductase / trans-2-enoyl-CoA reductase
MLSSVVRHNKALLTCQSRAFGLAAKHSVCGNPLKVLKLEQVDAVDTSKIGPKEMVLKMLAAPINPSDTLMVQGRYGIAAKLPATAGNEGVGVVQALGKDVSSFKVGDWVIPRGGGFGTWCQEALVADSAVDKVANDIPVAYAATIGVNPCTAYRLLKDFGNLQPGDFIIQNAANSMVGYCVIQMANLMGIKTINVIRNDRPDVFEELRLLDNLGGTINITDKYLNSAGCKEILADISTLKVGFNAVGGESANDMARALPHGSTMVTYGGMSSRPIELAQETLNYKQLKMKGFWISQWTVENSAEDRADMLDDIAGTVLRCECHEY